MKRFEYYLSVKLLKVTKRGTYAIYLDEEGNIVSATEQIEMVRNFSKRVKKCFCKGRKQGDEDFEEFVAECIQLVYQENGRDLAISSLTEAINDEMKEKYFIKVYKPKGI